MPAQAAAEVPTGEGASSGIAAALRDLIDPSVIARLGDDPARGAAALGADAILGLSSSSRVGQRVRGMTIADVAAMSEEAFVAKVAGKAKGKQRESLEQRAKAAWASARKVLDIIEGGT
jgi:hypothetical protein